MNKPFYRFLSASGSLAHRSLMLRTHLDS